MSVDAGPDVLLSGCPYTVIGTVKTPRPQGLPRTPHRGATGVLPMSDALRAPAARRPAVAGATKGHHTAAATVNSVRMATQHPTDEADIRQRIDELAGALHAMDLDALMSIYAPDVVSFDVEPPLQHVGAEAKRKNWERVFAAYQYPLGYEICGLAITAGDDVAYAHSLNRLSGTLRSGTTTTGFWVRATMCFQKINGDWFITHDQVSVPLDLASGTALLNLEP